MNKLHTFLIIVVCALVTMAIRFLPFAVFTGGRKTPPYIAYLGKVLPCAIMGMLVVFCLKNVSFAAISGFLPELIAGGLTVALHLWKRNTLVSIVGGTVCYMLLVQFVFK